MTLHLTHPLDEPEPSAALVSATHAIIRELVAITEPIDRAALTFAAWHTIAAAISDSLAEPTRQ
jgi:hypothetical protein